MASQSAVQRLAPLLRPRLSRANAARWDQILAIISPDGRAVLADVLRALYPRHKRADALTKFRQFRRAVSQAAKEATVRLSLETDGQTRATPSDRSVWFEAEDRVAEDVTRLVEAEVRDVERSSQYVKEDRPLRFFVSYAHDDSAPKDKLLGYLRRYLDIYPHARFELWSDVDLLPGKKWRAEIRKAMKACDFGLLLVSPSFLASKFITKEELPYLLRKRQVIPVALKRILFDGSQNLKGLEERQIFHDAKGKTFCERTSDNTREAFVRELFQKICKLLAERSEPTPAPPAPAPKLELGKPKYEHHLRLAVDDFDAERFVHTEGVLTTMSKDLEAAPPIDPSQRKDAITFLMEWVMDANSPPYCALLGEYGMGKTTTCKALARDLLDRRAKGESVPLPIYLDLRHVGESAKEDLVLDGILELILKRSWRSGPGGAKLNSGDIIRLVQDEGALVIWDGLDEVLVHLDANPGQMFTRQLFRILPPKPKGKLRRGCMLISCRTHYFRTLRDQQTHFRAEDRDNVRAEDYRAPFLLLPFTSQQIREYLKHTLPDEDPDRVMGVIAAVHNLTEMAERPYTLSLIAEQFGQIERWKLEGRRVTGLMLYRHMVRSWLERDEGKHQLTADHKQMLMENLAVAMWRVGARAWSVGKLEQWLIDLLEARPGVAAHYKTTARELLKEDLRTATFLVREGDDQFRFAHTSLQEFFLAGYLRRALLEGRPEDWDEPRVSGETLDFLGQWLEEAGAQRSTAMSTLENLRDTYRARASELAFQYYLLAHRKGYLAPSPAGFQLPGADLTGWQIAGRADAPLVLVGMNLQGARLGNSRWRFCNLHGAAFDNADASRAQWRDGYMVGSSWRAAELEATLFRDCDLRSASFEGARPNRAQWLRCGLEGAMGLPAGRPEAYFAPTSDMNTQDAATARVAVATGHHGAVSCCAWSPDGERIVSASDDQTLRIWDAASGSSLLRMEGHKGGVLGCAWSPDGKRIVSASSDKTLRIWDAASGSSLVRMEGHQGGVRGCAWSPNGERIVSASEDNTLRIWDGASGASLVTLEGHRSVVRGCAWSPDGKRIASASEDKTLWIWDAASGASLVTLEGHRDGVLDCAWSPDGKRIVSASYDNTLRIWDAATGASLVMLWGHQSRVSDCAWSPNGERIVSASWDNTLQIWDAASGARLAELKGHYSGFNGCAWSPNGERIVSAASDSTLQIWDMASGARLVRLDGHESGVFDCAWSPNGERIVSASGDNTLQIWDAASGARLAELKGHQSGVSGCAWSPDGERVVSVSWDSTLQIWNAASGASLVTLEGHQSGVLCWASSPDGERIVSASADKPLRIWDAASGASLVTLEGHQNRVRGCAWSPDGERIVSASEDKTLRIWDAASGASLVTLEGHQGVVKGCAWSPDGERIVSASSDQTLRIWDATTGASLVALEGHQGGVSGCAWSPDGERIMSASWDGTVRVWNAATGEEVGPTIYHLRSPEGERTWCTVDYPCNKVVACGAEAWRSLGWLVRDSESSWPELLPSETFGPLPVAAPPA
jgi:WD40 repeat protein/uncharacterized protein YjbI with pentapeptide repeats